MSNTRHRKLWDPRPSDTGNRNIDGLSRRGEMDSVWPRLEYKFPEIKRVGESVWRARRDGRIRRTIMGDDRFTSIRKPFGPETEAEWRLLRDAALLAIGSKR